MKLKLKSFCQSTWFVSRLRAKLSKRKHKKHLFYSGLTVLFLILLIITGVLQLIDTPRDSAKAATANGVSIDKKYYNGSSEVNSIKVAPGGRVTVRLKYDNTNPESFTGVNITDSLPSGFQYVPGSLKNCYVDAECVTLSDSLFSGSNLSVGPGAGYFGYTTNATNTNLELGRKKYIRQNNCQYYYQNGGDWDWYTSYAVDGLTNSTTISPCTDPPGYTLSVSTQVLYDITGRRYIHQKQCRWSYQYDINNHTDYLISTVDNTSTHPNDCLEKPDYNNDSTGNVDFDILGHRYLHQQYCLYEYSGGNVDHLNVFAILGVDNTATNSTPCATVSGYNLSSGGVIDQDMSDTSRGYGYIEYQMDAPNVTGWYGTSVNMSGSFSSSALTQTMSNSIEVKHSPIVSFTKQYSLDGVNFSNSVSAATGQHIWVRLNYNNTGIVSADNVQIQDSIPSGFSLVPGSVVNKYVDANQVSLPDSVFSGSNLTIAPGAGYFGYSTSASTSNLELGRKKYIKNPQCLYYLTTPSTQYFYTTNVAITVPNTAVYPGTYGMDPSASNTLDSSLNCGSGHPAYPLDTVYNSSVRNTEITGYRYVKYTQCVYWHSQQYTSTYTLGHLRSDGRGVDPVATNTLDTSVNCPNPYGNLQYFSTPGVNDNLGTVNLDLLGHRYAKYSTCVYHGNNNPPTDRIRYSGILLPSRGDYGAGPTAGNNLNSNLDCPPGGLSYWPLSPAYSNSKVIDLLDTTRGYGYIQYQMTANQGTPAGFYGTQANIQDIDSLKDFTQVNSGGGSDITLIPSVVSSGLQLYYDASNSNSYSGSGQTITDLSGNSHHATLGKDSTANSLDPTFINSGTKSFNFNSVNDQFLETTLNSGFSSSFTAEFWMKRADNTNTGGSGLQQRLFTKFNSAQSTTAIALGIQDSTIQVLANDTIYNSAFIPNTSWQHVVLTYDQTTTTGKIYVNGVLQTSFNQALPANSSPGNIKIGIFDETQTTPSHRLGFHGDIAKVRIYNRPLSPTEIDQNFSAENVSYGFGGSSISLTVPSSVAFTPKTVSTTSQTTTVTLSNISYTDRRSSFTPWSSTISFSDCSTAGGLIPASNVTIDPGSISTITGSGLYNTPGSSGFFANSTTPRTLITNSAVNGGGTFTISPVLTLTIPAYSRAGTYTCTATISTA
jgi:uncharacterized repeat protein (TIGR01451 family)